MALTFVWLFAVVAQLGSAPGPLVGGYSPSKSALESMTTTLRLELRKQGIHVCVVKPAIIRTNIYKEALAGSVQAAYQLSTCPHNVHGCCLVWFTVPLCHLARIDVHKQQLCKC